MIRTENKDCWFRGEWRKDGKDTHGCIYHNEPNSLRFRDECSYKDEDIEKCKKFHERGK